MRVVPIYVPLIKALGPQELIQRVVRFIQPWKEARFMASGGEAVRSDLWGWHEVCKYIWGPPFWTVDVYIMMNKKKWDGLDPAQRDILTKTMMEYEHKTHDAQIKGAR